MQSIRTALLILTFAIFCAVIGARADSDPPKVAPDGPTWSAGSGFQFESKAGKKRESLSGIACPSPSPSPRLCVAAFDEGSEARYVLIDRDHLVPQPDRIVLLPDDQELDAEGAARDGDTVYITGSHSLKRGHCEVNPNSRHVFRFKVDAQTGRAEHDASGKPASLEDDHGNLWKILTANTTLREFAGKCLGKPSHGVNIEGLAVKDGMLYFGFREPAKDKHTYILPLRADQLFSAAGVSNAEPVQIKAGAGRGIRDMLAVPEGLLLLLGPDDDNGKDVGWSVALWAGSNSNDPKILADLDLSGVSPKPCPSRDTTDVKPEAMAMLDDGNSFRRLLILSDGMCDGGAMSFLIPK
jgi:hypothetical protein